MIALAVLLALLLAATCIIWWLLGRTASLSFAESDTALANPMQGFYTQCNTGEPERIAGLVEDGVPLVLLACNLNGYQDMPLDDTKLAELETALAEAERLGLGIIFRAAYGFSEGKDTVEPTSLNRVLEHIGQLALLLNRYADDLLCVQAGMLGPWGEWHSSALISGDGSSGTTVRNTVAAAWLQALDSTLVVQLRRPEFVRQAIASGLPAARLGLHNDALLASDTDMGTYADGDARGDELAWVDGVLPHGLSGGEMPTVSEYTVADNAVAEFRQLHLTYLNSRYNVEVLESWQQQTYQGENALDYITRYMGSRLYLKEAVLPQLLLRFGSPSLHCQLTLANTGFAPAQARLAYYFAVSQGATTQWVHIPETDITRTADGGVSIDGDLPLPAQLKTDEAFHMGLWVGYGTPDAGQTYRLVNTADGSFNTVGDFAFFAQYAPTLAMWQLAE